MLPSPSLVTLSDVDLGPELASADPPRLPDGAKDFSNGAQDGPEADLFLAGKPLRNVVDTREGY